MILIDNPIVFCGCRLFSEIKRDVPILVRLG